MPEDLTYEAPLLAAGLALAMAGFLLLRVRHSVLHRRLALVLACVALLHLGTGVAEFGGEAAPFWQRLAMAAVAGIVASVMWLGRSFAGQDTSPQSRLRGHAMTVLLAGCAALALMGFYYTLAGPALILTSLGRLAHSLLILGLVLALAQMEAILRSTREPLRYQIKFLLLGVGAMVAFRIYAASQVLLFGTGPGVSSFVDAAATIVSLGLVAFGLVRSRLRGASERLAISPQMVYSSLTVLVVGLYLIGVGLLGYLIKLSGQPFSDGLRQLVVFVAVLALAVAAFSRAARGELRRLIARHFLRSHYDYRTKWLEVTDAFEASASEESILDRLLELLSRTFAAARISIWLRFDADERFHRQRAANTEPPPAPLDRTHPVVVALASSDEAVAFEDGPGPGAEAFLAATRAVLCIPIRVGRDLIAFIALSAFPRGRRYGEDDLDLLRAIARHVAVLLSHARLAEERHSAAELEALHRFSAFCMHDLKNLAARLSLVTQNAEVHGDDPAFREAARKTIERTGREMTSLIAKLSLRSPDPGQAQVLHVEPLLLDILKSVDPELTSVLVLPSGSLPPVMAIREELEQVILNTILNARQALEQAGRHLRPADFSITAEQRNGHVIVTVADQGVGIGPAQLRTLFQPLKTTKKSGLGIGLYESRRLVEANRGRLLVESEAGRGTRVRIELSVAQSPPSAGSRAS